MDVQREEALRNNNYHSYHCLQGIRLQVVLQTLQHPASARAPTCLAQGRHALCQFLVLRMACLLLKMPCLLLKMPLPAALDLVVLAGGHCTGTIIGNWVYSLYRHVTIIEPAPIWFQESVVSPSCGFGS